MLSPVTLHPPIRAPLPEVTTARLDLRRPQISDLDALAEVFSNPKVWQFPYGKAFTREQTAMFLERQIVDWSSRGFGLWFAVERATSRLIGFVGISVPTFLPEVLPAVEVGWRLHPAAWGKGYASEGALAALAASFTTVGLHEVCSLPQADNPPSSRVCERIGMRLERSVAIPANASRGALQALLYKITLAQWRERRAAGLDSLGSPPKG